MKAHFLRAKILAFYLILLRTFRAKIGVLRTFLKDFLGYNSEFYSNILLRNFELDVRIFCTKDIQGRNIIIFVVVNF